MLCVSLSGCVSYDTKLKNNKGAMARCSSSGSGIGGMAIAKDYSDRCIAKYKQLGFVELPEAAPK